MADEKITNIKLVPSDEVPPHIKKELDRSGQSSLIETFLAQKLNRNKEAKNTGIMSFFGNVVENVVGNVVGKNDNSDIDSRNEESQSLIKKEIHDIEEALKGSYFSIGEKYANFILTTNQQPIDDVADIIKVIQPQIERKNGLQAKLQKLEQLEEEQKNALAKLQYEREYQEQKAKLDKALSLEVITAAEYEDKLSKYKNRLVHFEEMVKIEELYKAGVIDDHERKVRLFDLGVPY